MVRFGCDLHRCELFRRHEYPLRPEMGQDGGRLRPHLSRGRPVRSVPYHRPQGWRIRKHTRGKDSGAEVAVLQLAGFCQLRTSEFGSALAGGAPVAPMPRVGRPPGFGPVFPTPKNSHRISARRRRQRGNVGVRSCWPEVCAPGVGRGIVDYLAALNLRAPDEIGSDWQEPPTLLQCAFCRATCDMGLNSLGRRRLKTPRARGMHFVAQFVWRPGPHLILTNSTCPAEARARRLRSSFRLGPARTRAVFPPAALPGTLGG